MTPWSLIAVWRHSSMMSFIDDDDDDDDDDERICFNVAWVRGLQGHVTVTVGSRSSQCSETLAGCAREGYLQDGCHGVPLSSRSGTLVPRRPSHHILRLRFSASSSFRKPTPAHRTSLSTQHIRRLGIFDRWSDGLELAAWRTQRSGVWFWQF